MQVRERHAAISGQLTGDAKAEEAALFGRVEEAAAIGCKKGIMTQERMRNLCDQYLDRFGGP